MPKAYRVLAEKYQALLEADQPEQGYKADPNNPLQYTLESYELFVQRCIECTSYDDFRYVCKEFYYRSLPGDRYVEMSIHANVLYSILTTVISVSVPLLANTPSVDYLGSAIHTTLVSFSRMEYSPSRAVQDQKEAKEMWGLWYTAYTKYKESVRELEKGSKEAGVNLDI